MITVVSLAGLEHARDALRLVRSYKTDISLRHLEEFAYQHFGLEFKDLIGYYHPQDLIPFQVNWQAHTFWHFVGQLRKAVEANGCKPILVLQPGRGEDETKWQHLLERFWLGKRRAG